MQGTIVALSFRGQRGTQRYIFLIDPENTTDFFVIPSAARNPRQIVILGEAKSPELRTNILVGLEISY